METFQQLLDSDKAYIFDGAMGTMLYAKGIYINRAYDELNLVAADLVREVHAEYVRAGADIIETTPSARTSTSFSPMGWKPTRAKSISRQRGLPAKPPVIARWLRVLLDLSDCASNRTAQ